MGRRSCRPPEGAIVEKTYDGLEALIAGFAGRNIPLLGIVGAPGLGKSRRVQAAVKDQRALVVKGRKSALDLFTDLYCFKDLPVVFDDAERRGAQGR